jgi:hypothetical protein
VTATAVESLKSGLDIVSKKSCRYWFTRANLLAFGFAVMVSLSDCATSPALEMGRLIKGVALPEQWNQFLASAERGEIEEVADEPDENISAVDSTGYQLGWVSAAPTGSEVFKGKFRPEAKTSYSTAPKEPVTVVDSLLNGLPTDAQMTAQHHELVAKDSKHANHAARIDREQRNVTVKAWLYWVGSQSDNDYHCILGDTSELSSQTVFMNAEVSGLPTAKSKQQAFVKLRDNLRKLIATARNKNGAFVTPVPVRVTGSLLWDGEHRNPNNVGPKKPVDIRPKKAWEIHPIHDLVH